MSFLTCGGLRDGSHDAKTPGPGRSSRATYARSRDGLGLLRDPVRLADRVRALVPGDGAGAWGCGEPYPASPVASLRRGAGRRRRHGTGRRTGRVGAAGATRGGRRLAERRLSARRRPGGAVAAETLTQVSSRPDEVRDVSIEAVVARI